MNEILNINNVHGYLDKKDGTAYLNAGDVREDLGLRKLKQKTESNTNPLDGQE